MVGRAGEPGCAEGGGERTGGRGDGRTDGVVVEREDRVVAIADRVVERGDHPPRVAEQAGHDEQRALGCLHRRRDVLLVVVEFDRGRSTIVARTRRQRETWPLGVHAESAGDDALEGDPDRSTQPVAAIGVDLPRWEPVERDVGAAAGTGGADAQRDHEVAVAGDSEHEVLVPDAAPHSDSERVLTIDEFRVDVAAQLEVVEWRLVAAPGGRELERHGHRWIAQQGAPHGGAGIGVAGRRLRRREAGRGACDGGVRLDLDSRAGERDRARRRNREAIAGTFRDDVQQERRPVVRRRILVHVTQATRPGAIGGPADER